MRRAFSGGSDAAEARRFILGGRIVGEFSFLLPPSSLV
jgi:hypothetical protein